MKHPLLLALLLVSACGTPQEQCIALGTRDLQVVDRLIAESKANLSRGYAYETVTAYVPRWIDCTPRPTATVPAPPTQMCFEQVPQTTRQAVSIDLNAEAAKLKSLQTKRDQLAKAAQPLITQCKAKYPE